MEKLIYTWEQQIDDTNLICAKIEADGFKPDVIVGISRGGLIPGVMISHKLNIPFNQYMLQLGTFHIGKIIFRNLMIQKF